jgi:dTMP kinase
MPYLSNSRPKYTRGSDLFYVFEGVDGCGKSTQASLLTDSLKSLNHNVYLSKEPGDSNIGSRIGKQVRDMIFDKEGYKKLGPGVADLLFMADHVQNQYDISEHLDNKEIVICDRYTYSEFAYASVESKGAPKWTLDMYKQTHFTYPKRVFYIRPVGQFGDISWCLNRANLRVGPEAGKQANKQWNSPEEHAQIARAYDDIFYFDNNPYITIKDKGSYIETIEITEHSKTEDVAGKILACVLKDIKAIEEDQCQRNQRTFASTQPL